MVEGEKSWIGLFFFASRRRHTRLQGDWSSDVCSSDLKRAVLPDADSPPATDLLVLDPDELEELVLAEVGQTALFGARFRENAARALLRSEERRVGKECRSRWSPYH